VHVTSPRRERDLTPRRRAARLLTILGMTAVALGGCTPEQRDSIRESIGGIAGDDGEGEARPEPEQPGAAEPDAQPSPAPEPQPEAAPDPEGADDDVEVADPEPDDTVAADEMADAEDVVDDGGGETDDDLLWLLVLLGIVIAAVTIGFLVGASRRKRDRTAAERAVLSDTAWLLDISDEVPLPPGSHELARTVRDRTERMQDRLSQLAADTSGDEARVVLELRDAATALGTTVLARLQTEPDGERDTRTLDIQLGERRERLRAARRTFLVRTGRDTVEV
jgi:hypothetical protein